MLNYPTLLLVLVGCTALTTLLLVVAAFTSDALEEQRLWALGNVMACLGFGVGILTSLPTLVHGGVSYALMGLGQALILRGILQFCGRKLPWRVVAGITVGAFVLPAYYASMQPDQTNRLIVSGMFSGAINLVSACMLVYYLRPRLRSVVWISVAGFGVLGAALILRAVYLLLIPVELSNPQTMHAIMSLTILVVSLAQVTTAFGLIMLVSLRYVEKLNRLTLLDGLTGALNRVGMERMGQRILSRARQSQRSVSLVVVDADFFKIINDTHGHPVGDQVLVQLAKVLTSQVRPGDLVIRYGGEEFVLILDGSNRDATCRVAERLREVVASSPIRCGDTDIHFKVSIGVSCSDQHGYVLDQLMVAADGALYRAKQDGRNRVCAA